MNLSIIILLVAVHYSTAGFLKKMRCGAAKILSLVGGSLGEELGCPVDTPPLPTSTTPIPSPCIGFAFKEMCYTFNMQKVTYSGAQKACKAEGTTLAVFPTLDHNQAVQAKIKEFDTENMFYWIGVQRNNGNVFEWADGSKLEYTNWVGDGEEPYNQYNDVFMKTSDGQWNPTPSAEIPFVCSKEL